MGVSELWFKTQMPTTENKHLWKSTISLKIDEKSYFHFHVPKQFEQKCSE